METLLSWSALALSVLALAGTAWVARETYPAAVVSRLKRVTDLADLAIAEVEQVKAGFIAHRKVIDTLGEAITDDLESAEKKRRQAAGALRRQGVAAVQEQEVPPRGDPRRPAYLRSLARQRGADAVG